MAHRFSRSEKGKGIAVPPKQARRNPVIIPAANTNSLIEEHRFTLIGRVTNPGVQNTRALVDFFLQHWSVVGHFTGRDLGPLLFQFKFESEKDLKSILDKGPFHFKRWMILLQRWEPIVSDDFPSDISFWIKIHGIPLHYWTDQALDAIGSDLGKVELKDVDQCRVRVQLNGLKPLETLLDITLPSGTSKKVELHYEKLEKHCFLCHSLSHEDLDCPQQRGSKDSRSNYRDINQTKTLESLDSYRRARDERRLGKGRDAEGGRRDTNYYRRNLQSNRQRSPPRYRSRLSSDASVETRNNHKTLPLHGASPRVSASHRLSQGHTSIHSRLGERVWVEKGSHSIISHTPSPKPQREAMITSQEVNSSQSHGVPALRCQQTAVQTPLPLVGTITTPSKDRRSALQRIELPESTSQHRMAEGLNVGSQDRLPALQRLALPTARVPLLRNGTANSDSGRLQEVEIQYLEETFPHRILEQAEKPSSSRVPATERLSMPQVSPIRSLSEDRTLLETNLPSPVISEDADPSYQPPYAQLGIGRRNRVTAASAAGKRKAPEKKQTQPRKRTGRSPLQGASVKLRRVTKTQSSPRRKLVIDAAAVTGEQTNDQRAGRRTTNPPIQLIPARTRRGTDFRSEPSTLP